ncbi:KTSC domain-containing protein [Cupriavidus basilensis]
MNTTTAKPAIAMQPVDSSKIYSIGHDAQTGTLAIRFKNKDGEPAALYHYRNVTSEDFAALQGAESIGSHFHRAIKPFAEKYPYQRIGA